MFKALFRQVFGSRNSRLLKRYRKIVTQINDRESHYTQLDDPALKNCINNFKQQLAQGTTLDELLPEVFACVREAASRTLNMRHFDVQLIGGIALHEGKIAEMHTGEGKTLVATLPACLNALTEKGVHIVTVNDYLAKRDAQWMAPVYEFLGFSVGAIHGNMPKADRQAAYRTDITYATNNELGFDYLRDNMAFELSERVQRPLNHAIVDEVDSILIDEARTPLIISGPVDDNSELYQRINKLIPSLVKQENEEAEGDFHVDEKARQVYLSETGQAHIEKLLIEEGILDADDNLYSSANLNLLHHLQAALKAHKLFQRDVDYIVKNNEIIIVDEHTGRTMEGRRWSEGIHQAVEAKENVPVQNENQTLASITFQNFFRLYEKLSGMTGTADTEAYEFQHIYALEVVAIPTNKPNRRIDDPDLIFLTQPEKYKAVIEDIKAANAKGQPVLVGTASIEASEILSKLMTQAKIEHQVLNAKFHEQEAKIIAEAGRPGAITIATNMAGRGTDIVLGGCLDAELHDLDGADEQTISEHKKAWQERHQAVLDAGGLRVVGSERHESRRIDNQLRGRCARQGDPGSSSFYLSLEDNLMRIFAPPTLKTVMQKLGMGEGEAIRSQLVTRAIENAQRKVESHNFDIRKQLLEYDDVANEQRKFIYSWRDNLLMADESITETTELTVAEVIESVCLKFIPERSMEEQWDIAALNKVLKNEFQLDCPVAQWLEDDHTLHEQSLREKIIDFAKDAFAKRSEQLEPKVMQQFERAVMLQSVDQHWKEHLAQMDQLREGIHLRGYAQKDPKQEYKREAFYLFASMLDAIKQNAVGILFSFEIQSESDVDAIEAKRKQALPDKMDYQHDLVTSFNAQISNAQPAPHESGGVVIENEQPFIRETPKIGRNEPCHCGSGKKYKHCCGKVVA